MAGDRFAVHDLSPFFFAFSGQSIGEEEQPQNNENHEELDEPDCSKRLFERHFPKSVAIKSEDTAGQNCLFAALCFGIHSVTMFY